MKHETRYIASNKSGLVPKAGICAFGTGQLPEWRTYNMQVTAKRHGLQHTENVNAFLFYHLDYRLPML